MGETLRRATKSGSWYSDDPSLLDSELERWLAAAEQENSSPSTCSKAIITPHAGYSYSGPVAAYSYQWIKKTHPKRIFLLGPSHYKYLDGCALSPATACETPIGEIKVNSDVVTDLRSSGKFTSLSLEEDEAEHSLELQLPYIMKSMEGHDFTLVHVMVGSLSREKRKEYASILKPYFDDESTCFIISSDFCHWGRRFDYTRYDKRQGEIWQSISKLDQEAMKVIEEKDPEKFHLYLQATKNTICGRSPIILLLEILQISSIQTSCKFLKYEQSSHCTSQSDSSVSYAAAVVTQV